MDSESWMPEFEMQLHHLVAIQNIFFSPQLYLGIIAGGGGNHSILSVQCDDLVYVHIVKGFHPLS